MFDLLPQQLTAVQLQNFAQTIARMDGVAAFNDDSIYGFTDRQHIGLSLTEPQQLVAAAVWQLVDGCFEVEFAVHPQFRQRGIGSELFGKLREQARFSACRELKTWAHADTAVQQRFAQSQGLQPVRKLYKLALPLSAVQVSVGDEVLSAAGGRIESFCAARDSEAWVALNAKVFASHPEQGRVNLRGLQSRLASDWADPENFLIYRDSGGQMRGYNWLKITADEAEIYVLGVDPDCASQGVGRALLAAGLRRFQELGRSETVLYVDADNAPALRLYSGFGFAIAQTHTQCRVEIAGF